MYYINFGDIMVVFHTLEPVYSKDSKVLILGSMPSIKSREIGFYYSHPQNRFWPTLEKLYKEKIAPSKDERIKFLKKHHIALYDVIKSCDISSSSDSTIKNVVPNDLSVILKESSIKYIFTTVKKAYELYNKYCYPITKIEATYLPSTSAANCPKGIEEKLISCYQKIKDVTEN